MAEPSDELNRKLPRARVASLEGVASGDVVELADDVRKHLERVRRLAVGDAVEAFDGHGFVARGRLAQGGIKVTQTPQRQAVKSLVVCSAVPKGSRADWLAEKLGELGVTRWQPILTRNSVVDPGRNKIERWRRLASAAATQSRAACVLDVAEPLAIERCLAQVGPGVVLTTERSGEASLAEAAVVYVGPEGGWSTNELDAFADAGCTFTAWRGTVLRVETAATVAAARIRLG